MIPHAKPFSRCQWAPWFHLNLREKNNSIEDSNNRNHFRLHWKHWFDQRKFPSKYFHKTIFRSSNLITDARCSFTRLPRFTKYISSSILFSIFGYTANSYGSQKNNEFSSEYRWQSLWFLSISLFDVRSFTKFLARTLYHSRFCCLSVWQHRHLTHNKWHESNNRMKRELKLWKTIKWWMIYWHIVDNCECFDQN